MRLGAFGTVLLLIIWNTFLQIQCQNISQADNVGAGQVGISIEEQSLQVQIVSSPSPPPPPPPPPSPPPPPPPPASRASSSPSPIPQLPPSPVSASPPPISSNTVEEYAPPPTPASPLPAVPYTEQNLIQDDPLQPVPESPSPLAPSPGLLPLIDFIPGPGWSEPVLWPSAVISQVGVQKPMVTQDSVVASAVGGDDNGQGAYNQDGYIPETNNVTDAFYFILTQTPSFPILSDSPNYLPTVNPQLAHPSESSIQQGSIFSSTQPSIFISQPKFKPLQQRQVTPYISDPSCASFWTSAPEGYNGTQVTHCFPLSAIGRLDIITFRGQQYCTGSVIGPHTILTSAHCFYPGAIEVDFAPGLFGDYKPFGVFKNGTVYTAQNFTYPVLEIDDDYAIVKFNENIGDLTGWLGVEYYDCPSDQRNTMYNLTTGGYREDHQDELWVSACGFTEVDACYQGGDSGSYLHACDTLRGCSGGPMIQDDKIIGIHQKYNESYELNQGIFISRELMEFIQTYIE